MQRPKRRKNGFHGVFNITQCYVAGILVEQSLVCYFDLGRSSAPYSQILNDFAVLLQSCDVDAQFATVIPLVKDLKAQKPLLKELYLSSHDFGSFGDSRDNIRRKLHVDKDDVCTADKLATLQRQFRGKPLNYMLKESEDIFHSQKTVPSDVKDAVVSTYNMGATGCLSTFKSLRNMDEEQRTARPVFMTTNEGRLRIAAAEVLFQRCSTHIGRDAIVSHMNYNKCKPVLLNCLNAQTPIIPYLRYQGINEHLFLNKIVRNIVRPAERQRHLMFIGPHRAGKTKLADSICSALDGTTVSLETEQGMNFILSSFNDQDNGVCILEDVSYTSLKDVMDKRMRTHLDGTRMTQNPKYKGTRTAACPPFLTTTNVAFGPSNSPRKLPYVRQYRDQLNMPAACRYTLETSTVSRSLTHPEQLLVGRRDVIVIPRVLDEYCVNGVMHTFAPKAADFIDFLMVRCVPACALLFRGTPCTFSPCHGDVYNLTSHHISCRWMCQLTCDANDDVDADDVVHKPCIDDFFLFDVRSVEQVRDAMLFKKQLAHPDLEDEQQVLRGYIDAFIDNVWAPWCFAVHLLKGGNVNVLNDLTAAQRTSCITYIAGDNCDFSQSDHLQPNIGEVMQNQLPTEFYTNEDAVYNACMLTWQLEDNPIRAKFGLTLGKIFKGVTSERAHTTDEVQSKFVRVNLKHMFTTTVSDRVRRTVRAYVTL